MNARRFLRENGLLLVTAAILTVVLLGQSLAGHRADNEERQQHERPPIGYAAYLRSGNFLEALFENWESEFLEMGFYVMLTAFLYQKGSAESKKLSGHEEVDEDPRRHVTADAPWPVRRGGLVLKLYEHSLSSAFLALFLLAFVGHAVFGLEQQNDDRGEHGLASIGLGAYVTSSRFWFESLQNWQSEFVGVGAIVLLSIYLRQRGSPESKPVAAPHAETGG